MKEYVSMIDQYGLWTVVMAVILSIAIPLLKRWVEKTTLFSKKGSKVIPTNQAFFLLLNGLLA